MQKLHVDVALRSQYKKILFFILLILSIKLAVEIHGSIAENNTIKQQALEQYLLNTKLESINNQVMNKIKALNDSSDVRESQKRLNLNFVKPDEKLIFFPESNM